MYSHDKQNYAILPESVKFRDEFRSFRNNFVNECGDGSCDTSNKTGRDWFDKYEALGGKDGVFQLWKDSLPYNGLQDLNYPFDGDDALWEASMMETEVPVWLDESSYDDFVKLFGTPEQAVQDEQSVNECGAASCAGGSCDNSGKTGFDWCMEYGELDGQDMSWLDFAVDYTGDINRFDNQEEVEEFLSSISYDDMVAKFGTPEEVVAKEGEGGLATGDYIDPETNLEIGESCCCGGKKKNNKKSKWMPFWAKKNKKGKSKVEEALETLKRLGYEAVLNEATNEITLIVNTYIKHETTKAADNRTPEGRRTYHMNAKAYGLEDYRPKKGEEAPKETAETRKEMLQRAMKKRAEANALGKDAQQMGSTTIGMIHRKADFDSSKSWTWVDTAAIKDFFADFGLNVSEQHTQATVSQDVDEEPVADWGNYGPYGENSNYITYFTTYSERTWALKITGTPENWSKFCSKELDYDLAEEDMDGNTYNLTYPENKDYFEEFITKYIPNYKYGKGYEINVTLKQD